MMYKVAIIDDEYIIRKGLQQSFDWNSHDCEVIGDAENGKDGLELICRLEPDIVLSDIKMPDMTGLEMIAKLRALKMQTKFIVMTGFQDFEYAKSAVNLRVDFFISKPVSSLELGQALESLSQQIKEDASVRQQMETSAPAVTQMFLKRLINNQITTDSAFYNEISHLELPGADEDFAVLLVSMDNYNKDEFFDCPADAELFKYGILNIAEEMISRLFSESAYYADGNVSVIVVNIKNAQANDFENLVLLCDEICQAVNANLHTTITIGVGHFFHGYEGVERSYREALEAIDLRYVMGKNRVIRLDCFNGRSTCTEVDVEAWRSQVISQTSLGFADEAIAALNEMKNHLVESAVSLEKIRILTTELSIVLVQGQNEGSGNKVKSISIDSQAILGMDLVSDIFDELEKLITAICVRICNERQTQQRELVEQVVEIVGSSFNEEELQLQNIAKQIHANPSYLSAAFKKEMNINFVEYLTAVRMEKAKVLLRTTGMKAFEVSYAVGYSNPQYFSICFKKYTGMSPVRYKKQ